MSMVKEEYEKMVEMQDNTGADKYPLQDFNHIGKRQIRRLDGIEKASGRAIYTMDIQLPGMLHMKFLTCPYPNAKIVKLDTSRAEAFPGVRGVLRYDDPELPEVADLGGHGPTAIKVIPDVARFEGEPVGAAVAADTEAIAEEAVRLIRCGMGAASFCSDCGGGFEARCPHSPPGELSRKQSGSGTCGRTWGFGKGFGGRRPDHRVHRQTTCSIPTSLRSVPAASCAGTANTRNFGVNTSAPMRPSGRFIPGLAKPR